MELSVGWCSPLVSVGTLGINWRTELPPGWRWSRSWAWNSSGCGDKQWEGLSRSTLPWVIAPCTSSTQRPLLQLHGHFPQERKGQTCSMQIFQSQIIFMIFFFFNFFLTCEFLEVILNIRCCQNFNVVKCCRTPQLDYIFFFLTNGIQYFFSSD